MKKIVLIIAFISLKVSANSLPDNLRSFILDSSLGQFHYGLTDAESDTLIQYQLQLATSCIRGIQTCEGTMRSIEMIAQEPITSKHLQTAIDLYITESKRLLGSDVELFTSVTVPLAFIKVRYELLKQKKLKQVLDYNSGHTPIDYKGVDRLLINDKQWTIPEFNEFYDLSHRLSRAFIDLFAAFVEQRMAQGDARRSMLALLDNIFKDILNNHSNVLIEDQSATTFIVEHYSNRHNNREYSELSAIDYIMHDVIEIDSLESHKIAFPLPFYDDIARFLLNFRIYFHENEHEFTVNQFNANSLDLIEQLTVGDDIAKNIYRKAITPNLRRLFNSTIKLLTTQGEISQLSESAVSMKGLISDNFKTLNYGKTFAAGTVISSVLSKVPTVILGEIQRHGCQSDDWILPSPFNMLLEDKCVFTPSFKPLRFPITASTTYSVQDNHDYTIELEHLPTSQVLFTKSIGNGEEIKLNLSTLIPFRLNDLVLNISNSLTGLNLAKIQLSEVAFQGRFAGVIKNQRFYFVEKLNEAKFLVTRADEYGCPLYPYTEAQQKRCLNHKLFEQGYDDIPDYFYKNMRVLNFAQPNNVRSLDQYLVDIELKREQERIDQLILQHRHKALVNARNWLLYGIVPKP